MSIAVLLSSSLLVSCDSKHETAHEQKPFNYAQERSDAEKRIPFMKETMAILDRMGMPKDEKNLIEASIMLGDPQMWGERGGGCHILQVSRHSNRDTVPTLQEMLDKYSKAWNANPDHMPMRLVAAKKDDKLIVNVKIYPKEFGYKGHDDTYSRPERCKIN